MCILGPAWALDTYGIRVSVLREINEIYFREALSVQRLLRDDFRRETSQGGMWLLNLVSSGAAVPQAPISCRRHQARLLVPTQLHLS